MLSGRIYYHKTHRICRGKIICSYYTDACEMPRFPSRRQTGISHSEIKPSDFTVWRHTINEKYQWASNDEKQVAF
jgi:hypothetical protein